MDLFAKKLLICLTVFSLGVLPTCAKLEGGISKSHVFDSEKTIMNDFSQTPTIRDDKYWTKNVFFGYRYRPYFMLSNKELYNLMPERKSSVVQRIQAPAVYNISLKTSSVKKISLAAPAENTQKQPSQLTKPVIQKKINTVKAAKATKETLSDAKAEYTYEQAKNQGVDSDQKIDTAISLKQTNKKANYNLAIDLLDDVTRVEPYNAYAFYLKGELYSLKKDNQNAIRNYTEALNLNPTSKQSLIGIAKILEPTNKQLAQKYYEMGR